MEIDERLRRPITSFRDLVVWQRAMDLAEESYRIAGLIPWARGRNLRDQIQRSGSSIPANIAEGNGRQRLGDYLRFLSIANGSLMELQTHIELGQRLGILKKSDVAQALDLCGDVSRLLRALVRALEKRR